MSTETLDNAFDLFRKFTKSDKETLELIKVFRNTVDEEVQRSVRTKVQTLSTKEDVSEVRHEISNLEIRMTAKFGDTIKWMFLFWVGQLGAMFGFLYYFLK